MGIFCKQKIYGTYMRSCFHVAIFFINPGIYIGWFSPPDLNSYEFIDTWWLVSPSRWFVTSLLPLFLADIAFLVAVGFHCPINFVSSIFLLYDYDYELILKLLLPDFVFLKLVVLVCFWSTLLLDILHLNFIYTRRWSEAQLSPVRVLTSSTLVAALIRSIN